MFCFKQTNKQTNNISNGRGTCIYTMYNEERGGGVAEEEERIEGVETHLWVRRGVADNC